MVVCCQKSSDYRDICEYSIYKFSRFSSYAALYVQNFKELLIHKESTYWACRVILYIHLTKINSTQMYVRMYISLSIIRIFLKNQKHHFKPLFNACHEVQFQKILMKYSKVLIILGPKIPHSSHFGHSKNVYQERASSHFCVY